MDEQSNIWIQDISHLVWEKLEFWNWASWVITAVDNTRNRATVIIDWWEIIEVEITSYKSRWNITCIFKNDQSIRVVWRSDWLYVLWIDKDEIFLNNDVLVDEEWLLDWYITSLLSMLRNLDIIKIGVYQDTLAQTQYESLFINDYEESWRFEWFAKKKIRYFHLKEKWKRAIEHYELKIIQLDEILSNLWESIAMYSDEKIVIEEEFEQKYNEFLDLLKKVKANIIQIRTWLCNWLESVKKILTMHWINYTNDEK